MSPSPAPSEHTGRAAILPPPGSASLAAVLSLQRTAGNAAVTAVLFGGQPGQTVQRCGGHPCAGSCSEQQPAPVAPLVAIPAQPQLAAVDPLRPPTRATSETLGSSSSATPAIPLTYPRRPPDSATSPVDAQAALAMNPSWATDEQATDGISSQVMRMPEPHPQGVRPSQGRGPRHRVEQSARAPGGIRVRTVQRDDSKALPRPQSKPKLKCPDDIPGDSGFIAWPRCFEDKGRADEIVKRLKAAHIEAQTGNPLPGSRQIPILFKPLDRGTAVEAGTQFATKDGGLTKGTFRVEPVDRTKDLHSFTFTVILLCPEAVPLDSGFIAWPSCFTESGQDEKAQRSAMNTLKAAHLDDAHIKTGVFKDPKTGKSPTSDRTHFILYRPLTLNEAEKLGAAAQQRREQLDKGGHEFQTSESKTHPIGFTFELRTNCPKGFESLGTFTITSYFTADEKQFAQDGARETPCGLPGRTLLSQFLHAKGKGVTMLGVDTEGNGRTLKGDFIRHTNDVPCYEPVDTPMSALGPLDTSSSVAVDKAVIALGTELWIEGVGNRTGDDIGGSVDGKQIDVYKGLFDKAKNTTMENQLVCKKK
jgi:hypothetical protein